MVADSFLTEVNFEPYDRPCNAAAWLHDRLRDFTSLEYLHVGGIVMKPWPYTAPECIHVSLWPFTSLASPDCHDFSMMPKPAVPRSKQRCSNTNGPRTSASKTGVEMFLNYRMLAQRKRTANGPRKRKNNWRRSLQAGRTSGVMRIIDRKQSRRRDCRRCTKNVWLSLLLVVLLHNLDGKMDFELHCDC
jgi:hypothetical protein